MTDALTEEFELATRDIPEPSQQGDVSSGKIVQCK